MPAATESVHERFEFYGMGFYERVVFLLQGFDAFLVIVATPHKRRCYDVCGNEGVFEF